MTSISNSTAPYTGQLIANRFQVKHLISQGAMGAVYYAEDAQQKEKPVAVKFLSQSLENEEMQQRFVREAGIGARLGKKSIHIVQVLSWGMHEDKIPFYVMEFLSGKSLKDLLKEQNLSLPRFFTICRQICLGLSVAHQGIEINGILCPVIHRDVKPANIMIASAPAFGELVKILDFGIAKLVGDQVKLTHARAFLGTLAYSSPEQMEGRSLDNRSDIYSLGVVMFEMLTGQSPWKIENAKSYGAWYRIHHAEQPRNLLAANPKLKFPQELENLVMQCLAKEPSDRPSTVGEVLKALEHIETRIAATNTPSQTTSQAPEIHLQQVLSEKDDIDSGTIIQAYQPQEDNPTLNLEDAELIAKFIRGDRQLAANQNLQVSYSFNRLQLTTRKLEIVALMDLLDKPKTIVMKPLSKYGGTLHKILSQNYFVPWGEAERTGFVKYQQYVPPNGYEFHYTEMGLLWKEWWPKRRDRKNHDINLSLMVSLNNSWYPIQDIVGQSGTFYIKTLAGEITLDFNDKLVWISQVPKVIIDKPTALTGSEDSEKKADNKPATSEQIYNKVSVGKSKPSSHQPELKPANDPEKLLKALKARAIKNLATYLVEGETTTITEVMKNERGEIISTKTTTVNKPCPEWVVEYLLNKNHPGTHEEQATTGEQVKKTEEMGESPLMWRI
jgi:serine/threonine protein kinase